MKDKIYAASYFPIGADSMDEENMETVFGDNLRLVVAEAKSKNSVSVDECYRVRLLAWEEGMGQYCPAEFYDCYDLRAQ